jgi:hypothetical protein
MLKAKYYASDSSHYIKPYVISKQVFKVSHEIIMTEFHPPGTIIWKKFRSFLKKEEVLDRRACPGSGTASPAVTMLGTALSFLDRKSEQRPEKSSTLSTVEACVEDVVVGTIGDIFACGDTCPGFLVQIEGEQLDSQASLRNHMGPRVAKAALYTRVLLYAERNFGE